MGWAQPQTVQAHPVNLRTFVEYKFSRGRFHADSFPQAGPDCYPCDAGMLLRRGSLQVRKETLYGKRTRISQRPVPSSGAADLPRSTEYSVANESEGKIKNL
jgi:hypothetical protein